MREVDELDGQSPDSNVFFDDPSSREVVYELVSECGLAADEDHIKMINTLITHVSKSNSCGPLIVGRLLDLLNSTPLLRELRDMGRQLTGVAYQSKQDIVASIDRFIDSLRTGDAVTQQITTEMRKHYRAYQFSSGGVLTALCPHGIVYYIKLLIRQEGPGDVLDCLRSFAMMPKLVMYDNINAVIQHSRVVLSSVEFLSMWGPNSGCIWPASSSNIEVAIDAINRKKPLLGRIPNLEHSLGFYDRFHEGNSKKQSSFLRRMDLISVLCFMNSQVAEQFNKMLKEKIRSFNQMKPDTIIIYLSEFATARSESLNSRLLRDAASSLDELRGEVTLNVGGQVFYVENDYKICSYRDHIIEFE
jgi:hypothetical protein